MEGDVARAWYKGNNMLFDIAGSAQLSEVMWGGGMEGHLG